MAYATQSQVAAYISGTRMDGSSKPNLTQITSIIADRAAVIDSALGSRGIAVPVAGPAWFVAELAVLNAKGAAGDVLMQAAPAFVENQAVVDPYAKELQDEFTARLVELQEGIGIPVGLTQAENQQAPMGFFADSGSWGTDMTAQDAFGDLIASKPAFQRGHSL